MALAKGASMAQQAQSILPATANPATDVRHKASKRKFIPLNEVPRVSAGFGLRWAEVLAISLTLVISLAVSLVAGKWTSLALDPAANAAFVALCAEDPSWLSCSTKLIQPSGVVLSCDPGLSRHSSELPPSVLLSLVHEHGLVVLRGFALLSETAFRGFASQFGETVEWSYGDLLRIKPDATEKGITLSQEGMPLHWDLVFPPPQLESNQEYSQFTADFQLFQCIHPGDPATGWTTFLHGRPLLRALTKEKLAKWRDTRLTYQTSATKFSGAKARTFPLVMSHPRTGEAIFRFVQPSDSPLQAIQVSSPDLSVEQLQLLLTEIITMVEDSRWFTKHVWQKGDILIGDNHLYIHGRTALGDSLLSSQRELWRVQTILPK